MWSGLTKKLKDLADDITAPPIDDEESEEDVQTTSGGADRMGQQQQQLSLHGTGQYPPVSRHLAQEFTPVRAGDGTSLSRNEGYFYSSSEAHSSLPITPSQHIAPSTRGGSSNLYAAGGKGMQTSSSSSSAIASGLRPPVARSQGYMSPERRDQAHQQTSSAHPVTSSSSPIAARYGHGALMFTSTTPNIASSTAEAVETPKTGSGANEAPPAPPSTSVSPLTSPPQLGSTLLQNKNAEVAQLQQQLTQARREKDVMGQQVEAYQAEVRAAHENTVKFYEQRVVSEAAHAAEEATAMIEAAKEKEIRSLHERIDHLQQEMKKYLERQQLNREEEEINNNSSRAKFAELEKQLAVAAQAKLEIEKRCEALGHECRQLKDFNNDILKEMDKLKEELSETQQHEATAPQQNTSGNVSKEEYEALRAAVAEKDQQFQALAAEQNNLSTATVDVILYDQVQSQLNQASTECLRLQEAVEAERRAHQAQMDALRREVEEAKTMTATEREELDSITRDASQQQQMWQQQVEGQVMKHLAASDTLTQQWFEQLSAVTKEALETICASITKRQEEKEEMAQQQQQQYQEETATPAPSHAQEAALEEIKKQLQKSTETLSAVSAERGAVLMERDKLHGTLAEVNSKLLDAEKQIVLLQERLAAAMQEHEDARQRWKRETETAVAAAAARSSGDARSAAEVARESASMKQQLHQYDDLITQMHHTVMECLTRSDADIIRELDRHGEDELSFPRLISVFTEEFTRMASECQRAARVQLEWEKTYTQASDVNETLNQQVADAWKTIGSLREELSLKDDAMHTMQRQLHTSEERMQGLHLELTASTNALQTLQEEREAWADRLRETATGAVGQEAAASVLQTEISELTVALQEREDELLMAQRSVRNLQQVLEDFKEHKSRDVEELTMSMQCEIDDLKAQLADTSTIRAEYAKTAESMRVAHSNELARKNIELTALHQKLAELRGMLEKTAKQLNGESSIDKSVISHLIANYVHALIGQKKEMNDILKVLSGLLDWDEEMQERVGLLPGPLNPSLPQERKGRLFAWRNRGSNTSSVAPSKPSLSSSVSTSGMKKSSLAAMWVDFLLSESAGSAAAASAEAPPALATSNESDGTVSITAPPVLATQQDPSSPGTYVDVEAATRAAGSFTSSSTFPSPSGPV